VPQNNNDQARAGSGSATGHAVLYRAIEVQKDLFEAFLACRTTLEDLSDRTAALGHVLCGSVIAAHLTGKAWVPDAAHNALADAINKRLGELSLPPAAPYQYTIHGQRLDGNGVCGLPPSHWSDQLPQDRHPHTLTIDTPRSPIK
jgi:hypothetical protein